jgi:hypothetical protein
MQFRCDIGCLSGSKTKDDDLRSKGYKHFACCRYLHRDELFKDRVSTRSS